MRAYGLFNDEGLVEGGFGSVQEAEQARDDNYEPEDELSVHELCSEHPDHAKVGCELCESEEEDENQDDEEEC